MIPHNTSKLPGRIVAAYGREYEVRIEGSLTGGGMLMCSPRGKRSLYACGDEVEVEASSVTQGVITALRTRRSLFHRADAFNDKLIAANVTQVVMVTATEPGFSDELLMRCLCAVEAEAVVGLIVLNKCDLEPGLERGRDRLAPFAKLGHAVLELSAREGCLDELRRHLSGHISLLVGQSGMGKTTLTNALIPGTDARVGLISSALHSGKHTTTHARWYDLPGGGALIDSPGLQAFGLGHLSGEQIENGFRDLRLFRGRCRFRDCRHDREPHCAYRDAVASGELDARRFQVLQTLLAECRHRPAF